MGIIPRKSVRHTYRLYLMYSYIIVFRLSIEVRVVHQNNVDKKWNSVADPGFSRGGGANPKGGANLLFGQFFQKLHENKEILGQRGAERVPFTPRSATGTVSLAVVLQDKVLCPPHELWVGFKSSCWLCGQFSLEHKLKI